MSQTLKSSRELTADYQRGFAAILMVAEHLISRDLNLIGGNNVFFYMLLYALMQVYFFWGGVFAPSGMKKSAKKFFAQKALRLLVPYIMWSSVAVAAKSLVTVFNGTFSFGSMIRLELQTLLYAQSMWFLLSLFLMQALFWILFRLLDVNRAIAVIVGILVMLLPLPDMLAFLKTQEMMPAFAAGLFYAYNKQAVQNILGRCRKVLWVFCAAFLACAPWYALYASENRMGSSVDFLLANVIALATAFAFWYLVDLIMTWVKPIQKSLSVLGNYSLQIYCIHMVFVEYVVVRYPAGIYGWPLAAVDLLYVLMGAVVSFLCVGMSYAVLDRIPIYRWIMLGKWPQKTK